MNENEQLRNNCPYPASEEEATAENLIRWMTASAFISSKKLMDSLGDDQCVSTADKRKSNDRRRAR